MAVAATPPAGKTTPAESGAAASTASEREFYRVSLDVSPQLFQKLEELSREIHGSKADVLRRSIALFDLAVKAAKKDKKIGVARDSEALETEFVGLVP